MNAAEKALWYIERHFDSDLSLEEIACAAGITRFHLVRIFGESMGISVMRYVRARRLAEAARALADGAPDILTVAIDARYGSHEAFSRAFRDEFGITPELFRSRGRLDLISPMEARKMDESLLTELEQPRVENGRAMVIAGLKETYGGDTSAAIPSQWQRFMPYFGHVAGQQGLAAYGVSYNYHDDGTWDYLTGVEVTGSSPETGGLVRVSIPVQRYLVFRHREHISAMRRTWNTIMSKWLPESPYQMINGPSFERYGESFNTETGLGGLEIWLPISA